ncbi:hypothetical protein HDE_02218 [Halotydeus destructor]|nr:hypothetical protein HDE_02218 [Halotydeus destructor]
MPDLFPLKTKAQQATWPGPSRKERAATGRLNLGDIAVFKGMSFNFGLCIPSTCKAEEVRNVLSHVLEPYLLKPAGALSCDTKTSISFETRFSKLTKHQVAAMWLIGSILGIVGLITSLHFLLMALNYRQSGNFLVTLPPFLSAISMVDNVLQLVKPSDRGARSTVVDMTKFIVVMFGVLAHIVVCLEIPISYYAFSSHTFLNNAFGDPNNQAILADSGLNIITFLGGVTSYSIMVPMARNKKLPFLFAIFDRWVRFVPSILVITAIEFIWPVLWSGPIFTRVADFTLKKCTENWWTNILFINNWYPVVDVCAGHTYSASVDFQLFILGLIATYITVRSVKAGLIYSVAMMVYGWLHIAYNAYKYETTGTLYVPDPIPINIVNYMDYIHMSTAIYIPAYFMGFIAGHYLAAGYRLKVDTVKDHIIWNIVAQLFFGVVIVQNGLYNGLRVIPHSWSPMQININRTMHTLGGAISFVYYSSLNHIFGYKLQNYGDDSVQEKSTSKFDLVSTMCRLSYSIYLSNYILIKSEFFGQKVLFPADWYHVLKRLFATALMIIMFAFVFQVLFIAPFNNIRRLLFDRKPVPKETKKVD